ncbi:MAG: hypothetical protein Q8R56_12380 [Polaromonas sp.]|nr:hypothetical protein [Polaromonas sp.]
MDAHQQVANNAITPPTLPDRTAAQQQGADSHPGGDGRDCHGTRRHFGGEPD